MEFAAPLGEFKKMLRFALPAGRQARRNAAEWVELRASRQRLSLTCFEPSTALPVRIAVPGRAWVPLGVMARIVETLRVGPRPTKATEVRVAVEKGEIRVDSFRVTHPRITLRRPPPPPLPPAEGADTSAIDLMAFALCVGADKVGLAGLAPRVEAARLQADTAILAAAAALRPLGIDRERIQALFDQELRRRARRPRR